MEQNYLNDTINHVLESSLTDVARYPENAVMVSKFVRDVVSINLASILSHDAEAVMTKMIFNEDVDQDVILSFIMNINSRLKIYDVSSKDVANMLEPIFTDTLTMGIIPKDTSKIYLPVTGKTHSSLMGCMLIINIFAAGVLAKLRSKQLFNEVATGDQNG